MRSSTDGAPQPAEAVLHRRAAELALELRHPHRLAAPGAPSETPNALLRHRLPLKGESVDVA
eukprot:9561728-Alexandrium_andersonii.AAC.1